MKAKGTDQVRNVQDIKIRIGANDLTNFFESGSVAVSPSKILIHPNWNPFASSYDGDLSILFVDKEVIKYSKFIKPVCLVESSADISKFDSGFVTGWGRQAQGPFNVSTPRQLKVPIITNELCFLQNPTFVSISSVNTFCAGNIGKNEGVCSGDSVKYKEKL